MIPAQHNKHWLTGMSRKEQFCTASLTLAYAKCHSWLWLSKSDENVTQRYIRCLGRTILSKATIKHSISNRMTEGSAIVSTRINVLRNIGKIRKKMFDGRIDTVSITFLNSFDYLQSQSASLTIVIDHESSVINIIAMFIITYLWFRIISLTLSQSLSRWVLFHEKTNILIDGHSTAYKTPTTCPPTPTSHFLQIVFSKASTTLQSTNSI